MTSAEIYMELSKKNKLHLLDDLERDGWITPSQYKDVRSLKEALNDNSKMATKGVSY